MPHVTPFLLFDGTCAEAMTFYEACLGGELTITRISDTPMKEQAPPEHLHKVAFAHLQSGTLEISATDWMHPTRSPLRGNTVGLYLTAGSYDELRPIFDTLASGADEQLLDDLRDMPFGTYGHLADRYGVHWFFRGERQG
jgi:PhnB protein